MSAQLTDMVVTVNDDIIGIVPNSLEFDEGLGEQKILPVSMGGGKVAQVYANDLESNFAEVTFQMRTTVENIEKVRAWKVNANRNVVGLAGEDPDGNDVTRVYTQAALVGNYKLQVQAEGTIDLSFMANAPI